MRVLGSLKIRKTTAFQSPLAGEVVDLSQSVGNLICVPGTMSNPREYGRAVESGVEGEKIKRRKTRTKRSLLEKEL